MCKDGPMARPRKTLPELVLAGTFRIDRHARLLTSTDPRDELTPTAPLRGRRRKHLWALLRDWIWHYEQEVSRAKRRELVEEFAAIVRALHRAGKAPDWLEEILDRGRRSD